MMATMQEQIREIMAGAEIGPRGNLEAVPEVDTDAAMERLAGQEADQEEEAETETEDEPEVIEEGESVPIKVADLAELLEWEPEAVYNIQVPLGEGSSVSLGEVKDRLKEAESLFTNQDATQKELADREAELQTREARLAEQVNMAAPAELIKAEAALQRAQDDMNGIDWVSLETHNPGQAALMRQKLTEQVRQATTQRDGIAYNIQQLQGDLQEQNVQAMKHRISQAKVELHRLIPTWANEATFNTEREQLIGHGIAQGVDEATLRSIADPKVIAWMYRDWQRDKAIAKAKPIEKPPKVLKPQAVQNKSRGQKAKVDKLVATAKANKSDSRYATEAAKALLLGRGTA